MPQSMFRVGTHMIWSTKKHVPMLPPDVRPAMHAFIAGVLRNLGCEAVNVGGTEDHVHVACFLTKNHAPVRVLGTVKRESSVYAKTLGPRMAGFTWQRGYGVFSIGPAHFDVAVNYVRNQEEHHRKLTFREEFMRFLKKYGMPCDERYLWD